MMKITRIACLLFLICHSTFDVVLANEDISKKREAMVHGGEHYVLPAIDLARMMRQGALGDHEAARLVSIHFGAGLGEWKKSEAWLVMSAENGNGVSALELAEQLAATNEVVYQCRALYWTKLAMERGVQEATPLFESTSRKCFYDEKAR